MSLPPEFAQRIGFIPGFNRSHETTPVSLEQTAELSPNGKGFLVVTRPFDEDDPERFLGTLPDGLCAKALSINQSNSTLKDFVVWRPEATQIAVEKFGFGAATNPGAKDDAEKREEVLRKNGYKGISMLDYGGKYIVLAAKKADPNPAPRPTAIEEVEFV